MEKFCSNCGKELENGKKCECKKELSNEKLFEECIEITKNFIKKPIDTLKENTNESKLNHALIILGINGIAMGLFLMAIAKTIYGIFTPKNYNFIINITSEIKIPYLKIFFVTFIVTIIIELLIATCCYFISNKLLDGKTDIKKMITLFSFSTIILSLGLLSATILSFINIYLAILIVIACYLLKTYYNYKGLEFVCETDINKLGYVLMPSVLIVSVVIGYLLPKIVM